MIKDMTKGTILPLILLFSLPILIGNIFQQFYQLADIFIVGHLLGNNALAAVGASAPIYFMFLIIAFSFTGGLTAVTAQRFGAKDYDGVRASVTHSIRASIVLSLILMCSLLFFLHPVMRILNVPDSIYEDSYNFIFILGMGMFLTIGFNLLSGFIRALGDSRTPLYFLIFSSLLNIVFNYVLIKHLHFGVIGSATGTILAISTSVICCLGYMWKNYPILRLKKEDWRYDKKFMQEHLHIAIPMSVQFSVLSLGIMVIQAVSNGFGEDVIVGFTIALRIEQLATQPLLAIGLAIATFAAQNYGARKIARIRRAVKESLMVSTGISIVAGILMYIYGRDLIGSFIEEKTGPAIEIGTAYLEVSMMFYAGLGAIFIYKNTLQSMGRPFYPVLSGFIELGIRSFAAIILAKSMGYAGIYWASPLAWLGGAICVFIGYYKNVYKKRVSSRLDRRPRRTAVRVAHSRQAVSVPSEL